MRSVGELLPLLLGLVVAALPAAAESVSPGGLARWPGDGLERCGVDGREWLPLAGECWYPVDLLTAEGQQGVWRQRNGQREAAAVEVSAYPYEVQRITLEDDSKVNLSAEDLERVGREQQQISALWELETPRKFRLPLLAPLKDLPPGGRFGARRILNDQPRSPHTGRDYSADQGVEIFAVADGRVGLRGDFFMPGQSVFIDHGDGLISMYFHLSEFAVEEGSEVLRGQLIGRVGATGRATGPHLHFGIRWHGARVDPALLLSSVEGVPALP